MAMIQKWLQTTGFEILVFILIVSTFVFVLAALIAYVCRQRSAAWQNLVWRTALLLAILLPIAIVGLPKIGLGLSSPSLTIAERAELNQKSLSTRQNANARAVDWKENANEDSLSGPISVDGTIVSASPTTESKNAADRLAESELKFSGIENAKVGLVVFWILLAILKLSQTWRAVAITSRWTRLAQEQKPSESPAPLVRYSHDVEVPVTVGILRPTILLPNTATEWSHQRREMVLNHERAHVIRHDVFWNVLAAAIKAVLWWQPMSWYAHRQLVLSSEKACDDFVLGTGIGPAEYARELFTLATQFRTSKQVWLPAACVAQPPIEQRIKSILAGKLDRRNVTGKSRAMIWAAALVAILIIGSIRPFSDFSPGLFAAQVQGESEIEKMELAPGQELLSVEVLVVDADDQPVPNAKIKPWAVLSSLGHGRWGKERTGGFEPVEVQTDENGKAVIEYAKYLSLEEKVRVTAITLSIDSPDHPYVSHENIAVPSDSMHKAILPAGAAVKVELVCKETKIENDKLYIMRSDYRPGSGDDRLKIDKDNRVRIPPMKNGNAQLLFTLLDEDSVTHFSQIVDLEIDATKGEIEKRVELKPAVRVEGRLGDEVPRPVKNGRVKARTIKGLLPNEINWLDWAEVKEDGSFFLMWPENTPLQIAALCDGYIGKNGKYLEELQDKNAEVPAREKGPFLRAQAFLNPTEQPVVIAMDPLETVYIEVEDAFGKKLEGIHVSANPNINWSHNPKRSSSQIYCYPLRSAADVLREGKHDFKKGKGIFKFPFRATSNSQGVIEIDLPAGRAIIHLSNERYQLAAKLGRRMRIFETARGKENYLKYVLQPKGLDYLGDWEDLCGMVFG